MNRLISRSSASVAGALVLGWCVCMITGSSHGADPQSVATAMSRELLKRNVDKGGRPLPVASHWATGFGDKQFSSAYQAAQLGAGHHVMPTMPMPVVGDKPYGEAGVKMAQLMSEWQAPISLRGGQWEEVLYDGDHAVGRPGRWLRSSPADSPFVINPEGKEDRCLSPLGAVAPWMEAGLYTGSSRGMQDLVAAYPDPPLVIFLSNNEANRLKFKNKIEEREQRYVDAFGTDTPPDQQRRIMGDGYIERYTALLVGLSRALPSDHWRNHALFVGYEAFGPPHFGRWTDWAVYSYTTEDRIDFSHFAWQGGSPSFYTHNWDESTDYRVWSPQVEAMNWVFMLDEVYRDAPDFWFELSVWDGNFGTSKVYEKMTSKVNTYLAAGQKWSPERYKGFVRYGMWLTTPRVVREFRLASALLADFAADNAALVEAVDEVWDDPVLQEFWRRGRLVPNRSRKHPYQTQVPERWRNVDRWFMLNSSLDPPEPWTLQTPLPVFSLARVIGEKGSREWLVYAHSPLGRHEGVEVEIPDYKKVMIDVAPAGAFFHVRESDGAVLPVGH